jgi:hypothetical protein
VGCIPNLGGDIVTFKNARVLRIPGVFLSPAKAGNFRFEIAQVLAENAVKSRSFPCNSAAKSLPFAPF